MRIGLANWGFMGSKRMRDGQWFSSADATAFAWWTLVKELVKQGHEVWWMYPDRDMDAYIHFAKAGRAEQLFSGFASNDRQFAYQNVSHIDWNRGNFPELDVLIFDWRWWTGYNKSVSHPKFMHDKYMQSMLWTMYVEEQTRLVGWDFDCQMTETDALLFDTVLEYGEPTFPNGIHFECPFDWVNHMDDFEIMEPVKNTCVYVGNPYDRDLALDTYFADAHPWDQPGPAAHFYGSWFDRDRDYAKDYAHLQFFDRIDAGQFRDVIQRACTTPLLLRPIYYTRGAMTQRWNEALYFGSLPIGGHLMAGVEDWLPDELIASSSYDTAEITDRAFRDSDWRETWIRELRLHALSKNDASIWVRDVIGAVS